MHWVEYTHNNLPSSAIGLSPFEISLGEQPPLLPSKEVDLLVPSIQDHIRLCQRVWQDTHSALEHTQESNQQQINTEILPLPINLVSLSTINIPSPHQIP